LSIGLLVCTVLVVCLLSPASAATSSKSRARVTFGVEPASARGADGRPFFSFGVTPGAIVYDHVAVLDYSSTPLSLQLYATDAIETSGGGFGLLPATTRPTGTGSWISLPARFATVRVPAESAALAPGQVVVPLVVRVPDNATPGDHSAGVVVSLRTVGANASGQRVILLQRVGTRVYIQVAGALAPNLAVTDLHASYDGTLNPLGQGQVTVSYLLRNTGNVNLAVGQSVTVSGFLGAKQVALAKVLFLLPGASLPESVVVPGLWPQFLLRTKVSARPMAPAGVSNIAGLQPLTTTTSLWAIPWPLVTLIALVVLAGFLAYRVRSRARIPARHLAGRPQAAKA
jgi:hypothetical protein